MPTIVKMPQLGESVAEGTIGRWLKRPGERVERDEPLVEVLTDKVNAEVPSPVSGVVQELLEEEGATVAVKAEIAIIADEAPEAVALSPAPPSDVAAAQPAAAAAEPGARPPAATGPAGSAGLASPPAPPRFTFDDTPGGGPTSSARAAAAEGDGLPAPGEARRFYTPVVLRMAQEHGIDLATVAGTGLGGRVTRRDLERLVAERSGGRAPAIAATPPPPRPPVPPPAPPHVQPAVAAPPVAPGAADETRGLTPMRRAIAQHMARARAEIPDAWSMVEVDATNLARYRAAVQAEWQAREGYELTYLPFFVKAVVAGLRAVPELNATWQGESIVIHGRYHLGIAVSVEQGLVVPVLRDADRLSVAGIARALRELVQKARAGKLALEDLQGATFTVNNPGALGSIVSQPIVPLGQAGIVTMEAIVKRPVVTEDEAIAIRSIMSCCLSFDHRVLDGAQALRFLRTVKQQIEAPEHSLY